MRAGGVLELFNQLHRVDSERIEYKSSLQDGDAVMLCSVNKRNPAGTLRASSKLIVRRWLSVAFGSAEGLSRLIVQLVRI